MQYPYHFFLNKLAIKSVLEHRIPTNTLKSPSPHAEAMWMVHFSDHSNDRKLRHLMPKPTIHASTPCCYCIHHDQTCVNDVRQFRNAEPSVMSSRWNPTADQLEALQEMYRRGVRSPSAQQIQQIAGNLRQFGKIEGKNVFYWFQNHKARERQKKRREQEALLSRKRKCNVFENPEIKHADLSRRDMETKHPRKLPSPSKWTPISEDSVSMHRAAVAEYGTDRCIQRELQQRVEKNDTCLLKDSDQENPEHFLGLNLSISLPFKNDDMGNEENSTLKLFPIWRNDQRINLNSTKEEINFTSMKITPNKFFEFLPLKN